MYLVKYIYVLFLGFGLLGCDGDETNGHNDAGAIGMGEVAGATGTGGVSGSAGALACGGSTCGVWKPGCQANDRCIDGDWLCGCDCDDEERNDDCGVTSCPDTCVQGCEVVSECVDGMLRCDCDCSNGGASQFPSCVELCAAWVVNQERCIDGFSADETFSDACLMQCEAIPNYSATLSFADCTIQNKACETLLDECSDFVSMND